MGADPPSTRPGNRTRKAVPRGRPAPAPSTPAGAPAGPLAVLASARLVALLTLLVAASVTFSPLLLRYPFTVEGMDALLWTGGPGLLLGILAVARLRAPLTASRAAIALLVGSALLVTLPFLLGYAPHGPLAVAWWNLVVAGCCLTLLSAIGAAQLLHAARDPSPAAHTGEFPQASGP